MVITQMLDGVFIPKSYILNFEKIQNVSYKSMSMPLIANEKSTEEDGGMKVDTNSYRNFVGNLF